MTSEEASSSVDVTPPLVPKDDSELTGNYSEPRYLGPRSDLSSFVCLMGGLVLPRWTPECDRC